MSLSSLFLVASLVGLSVCGTARDAASQTIPASEPASEPASPPACCVKTGRAGAIASASTTHDGPLGMIWITGGEFQMGSTDP